MKIKDFKYIYKWRVLVFGSSALQAIKKLGEIRKEIGERYIQEMKVSKNEATLILKNGTIFYATGRREGNRMQRGHFMFIDSEVTRQELHDIYLPCLSPNDKYGLKTNDLIEFYY